MQQIIKVRTFDGKLHDSHGQAQRHLNLMESDRISRVSHKLIGLKFSEVGNLIDDLIIDLQEIDEIRKDSQLEELDPCS